LERAALAFDDGVAPLVVVSGGKCWHGRTEAESMRDALIMLGIPPNHIVCEMLSQTTAENAIFTTRMARRNQWNHLGIVTCPWHLPRAVLDFQRCGMTVTPIPAAPGTSTPTERACLAVREWTCRHLDRVRMLRNTP